MLFHELNIMRGVFLIGPDFGFGDSADHFCGIPKGKCVVGDPHLSGDE